LIDDVPRTAMSARRSASPTIDPCAGVGATHTRWDACRCLSSHLPHDLPPYTPTARLPRTGRDVPSDAPP